MIQRLLLTLFVPLSFVFYSDSKVLDSSKTPEVFDKVHSFKENNTIVTQLAKNGPKSNDNSCGLAITTTVSGCYSVSGVSKATVSNEISWTSVPDGGVITVQAAGQTRTINVRNVSTITDADVHSPQVVAFELDATNAPVTITVTYGSCEVTSTATLPPPCDPFVCEGIGGTVFKDFNANGVREPGEYTGLPDIVVRAVTSTGNSFTTSTDSLGQYTIAVPTAQYPIRVEFTNIPTYAGNGTPNGPDGRTSVQFVDAPDCSVDLGVLNAQEHCQTDPLIMIPCFVNGDPLPAGASSGSLDALVAFPYSLRGNQDMSKMTELATASQVGSLWGTAYSKFTKKLYTSAVLHRHVGLGPGGLGGIYVTDMAGPTYSTANTSLYVNLTNLGIDLGSIPSNPDRGLPSVPTTASYDLAAFSSIGKVGIGDMDLAEDGSMLWFTNLHDGQLYSLRVPASGAPGPNDWAVHPLPNDNLCTGGTRRIWGLKTYQGKVYVGAVCDASVSKDKSDLRAKVYAYTPGTGNSLGTGGSYQVIFDFPLTYPKGSPDRTDFSIRGWFPWEDDFSNFNIIGTNDLFIIHPQPILANIEFDIDGAMVLGFNDRSGLQLGYQNYGLNPPSDTHYSNISGGDILRAYFSNGTFVLENGGKAGPYTGSSTTNYQGPGGGEFYNDDFYYAGGLVHSENANGALAIRPGSGEVVASTMDPLNDQAWSGGLRFLSNRTGVYTTGNNATSAYVVYKTVDGSIGTFGKATGLGGVGLACDLPTYLQIGNRVWLDTNQNGEQDPGEKGLSGINVSLYQGTTLITSTTTDSNGEYYFTYTPTSSTAPGSTTALLPNTEYQVVFGTGGQFASDVLSEGGGRYHLTLANATGGDLNDNIDSDPQVGTIAGITAPVISVTTGNLGSVNHSVDAGFYCLPTSVASISVTMATCPTNSTIANTDGRIDLSGIQNGDKTFLYTTSVPPVYTATGTSQPVVNGSASFTGLANPTSSTGTSYSIVVYNGPCCYTIVSALLPQQNACVPPMALVVTPGSCNTLTNQYTLTGTLSLTNAITDTAFITDGATSATIAITAGTPSVPLSLTGFSSGSGSHVLQVSYAGQTVSQTYTAPESCTVTATVSVSNAVVCAGQSATLVASGCEPGTISWSSGTIPATGHSVVVSTDGLSGITSPVVQTYTATCTIGYSVTSAVASVTINPTLTTSLSSATICAGQPVTLTATGGTSYTVLPDNLTSTTGLFTLYPTGNVSYTVIAANSSGCTASAVGTVTTNTLPVATLSSATICVGQLASLTATGGTRYTLLGNNEVNTTGVFTVSPTADASYTVVVSNSSGCSAVATGAVTVNPLPIALLNSLTICAGENASLTATGGTSYTLLPDNQANTTGVFTVSPAADASYTVVVANSSGCIATASAIITVNPVPTPSLSSATICAGQLASLTTTGGTSYTLLGSNEVNSTGLFTVSPVADASYTVVVGNSSGCSNTAMSTVTVQPVPAIGNVYAVCGGPRAYTIVLADLASVTATALLYELVRGTSFDTGTAITSGKTSLPASARLSPIDQPGTYWIRMYNQQGCYSDVSVEVIPCECPTGKCVPFVIQLIKRSKG